MSTLAMNTNNLLTAKEAAQTFGCCEGTLRRYRQKGVLKAGVHYRRKFAGNPNSHVLYKIKECQEALEGIMVFNVKDSKALENNKEVNSLKSIPMEFWIKWDIMHYFWKILDKDFGRKVDEESIHEIFNLLFEQLNEKQSINILNNIDPKRLPKLKKEIKETFIQSEKKSMQKALRTLFEKRL